MNYEKPEVVSNGKATTAIQSEAKGSKTGTLVFDTIAMTTYFTGAAYEADE